jgi:hypothetical protein
VLYLGIRVLFSPSMFTKEVVPEGGSRLDRPSLHDHVATRKTRIIDTLQNIRVIALGFFGSTEDPFLCIEGPSAGSGSIPGQ